MRGQQLTLGRPLQTVSAIRAIWLALLLLASSFGRAVEISVGGVSLEIPNPDGFSPVTSEMAQLQAAMKLLVPPTNEEFLSFIPDEIGLAVLSGEIPEFMRRFSVQTTKDLINESASTSEFAMFKKSIKTQNNELIEKVVDELPDHFKRINEQFARDYDVDLALSVSDILPMPVHEETDRTLAYSAFVKFELKNDLGELEPGVSVATVTVMHVRSKVLFLYCCAEESGLEWSRAAASQWSKSVVAANSSNPRELLKEALPSAVTRIDWGGLGSRAIVGVLIGLVVAVTVRAVRRGKAS